MAGLRGCLGQNQQGMGCAASESGVPPVSALGESVQADAITKMVKLSVSI